MRQRRKAKRAGQRQVLRCPRRVNLCHQGSQALALLLRKRFQFDPESALQRDRRRMTG
jgi:hypothetical protein